MHGRFSPGSRAGAVALWGFALWLGAGCASIKVTDRDEYEGERLARPDRIFVHDFAATAADLPAWSEAAKAHAADPVAATEEELATGRAIGVAMTAELVRRINGMGLEASRVSADASPAIGDIMIVGMLTSVDEGSGFKRVVIGFGSGAAHLTSEVEGYLATAEGPRKLGSGETSSRAGHSPGAVLPVAVTIATANPIGLIVTLPIKVGSEISGRNKAEGVGKRMAEKIADELEKKFQEQGWIED